MAMSPEHAGARAGKATSSLVAGMLGVDPYRSPRMTYYEVTDQRALLPPVPAYVAAAAERGQRLEALALDYGASVLGARAEPAPFRVHAEHPWCGDSADCLYTDLDTGEVVALGEAKTVALGGRDAWGEPHTDQVPDKVMAQAMWHLMHWPEVPRVVVPVLLGGYSFAFSHYVVERDAELQKTIFSGVREFWETYVLPRVEPPVTEQDLDMLRGRWPDGDADALDGSAEIERLAAAKVHWRDARKEAEAAERTAEAGLVELLGRHTGAHSDAYSITYRNNREGERTDWQALALHLGAKEPDVVRFTRTQSGARVLRVTKRKKKAAP